MNRFCYSRYHDVIQVIFLALFVCFFSLLSVAQEGAKKGNDETGTIIIEKLPAPEMYAHSNKMVSTLDYDDSEATSKARVERARKNSFVWFQIDDQPKQKITREKNVVIKGLSRKEKHFFKIVSEDGKVLTKYTLDFPNWHSHKVFISYSPGYGNWTVYPM